MMLSFVLIAILLFVAMLTYTKLARKYGIVDQPNLRSSHALVTLTGGGIIFPLAMMLYSVVFNHEAPPHFIFLLIGMLLISIVSFWDDIVSLPIRVRILAHLLAVTSLMYAVDAFTIWPWWASVIAYILIIGTINAYNFMDGINGITGVYSLAILVSCLYFNMEVHSMISNPYLIVAIMACVIFLFFNFRRRAKLFAGDVGSVGLGFWVISILLLFIIKTGDLRFILFLAVYGVDAVLTIIHRLKKKQNIFKPHRLHLYQLLANEKKISHLTIASGYGLLQLAINALIINTSFDFLTTSLLICLPLSLCYGLMKFRLMKNKAA